MSTITKQWLQQKISDMEATRDEIPFGLDEDDSNMLAALRIALASLEAEPVGFIARHKETGKFGSYLHPKADWFKNGEYEVLNAYTTPPAPVSVPDLKGLDEFIFNLVSAMASEELSHNEKELFSIASKYISYARERFSSAMLQGSEPVMTTYKLPANTPCKDAPEHIWLQTAGVWPENREFSELTWCSDNQHPDDTLYVRADVVTGKSPVIPDGYALVPVALTAENGAKACLLGEFSETKSINCPECFGDDECETCDGSGIIKVETPVSWTTIKAIWAKGVEHFAAAPQQEV